MVPSQMLVGYGFFSGFCNQSLTSYVNSAVQPGQWGTRFASSILVNMKFSCKQVHVFYADVHFVQWLQSVI